MLIQAEPAVAPAFINEWFQGLKLLSIAEAVPEPHEAAVFSADMIVGFCSHGNLASQRVGALAGPVKEVFLKAYQHGIRDFLLLQDAHDPDTPEFNTFPPHCLRRSEEAVTIPELRELPFSNQFHTIEKNSLNPAVETTFEWWLAERREISTAIVVGNCTDLCVYQLAMHLRLRANALNLHGYQVIVPANAVDIYDLPEDAASVLGGMTHPGDFFHQVFLYHMALNGIQVIRDLV
jgi:nicotinamidase-related amidase